jgi:chloramphenicol-sensitive protein RarD
VSAVLVTINWGVFIWALQNDRIIETSLGYYINPLVNIVLGGVFLGERLRRWQVLAIGLATLGVVNEIVSVGVLPWAGLALAFSFGFYGLVRKKIMVDSAVGLGVETTLLLPIAVGYLVFHSLGETGTLANGTPDELMLLALGGFVTVFPLVCFAAAALRLSLTALGLFQYLAPTVTLLVAVYYYGEPLEDSQWITFGCIWLALVIFSGEGLYHQRREGQT